MTNQEKVCSLLDYYTSQKAPENLSWSWGEGLLLYSLMKYDEYYKTDRYFNYVKRFHDYNYEKGIAIDSSDTVCPCLSSLELYKVTKDEKYKKITELGVDYINNSEKVLEGIPNHFGFGKSSKYPKSIWVDSLVMFSIFTSEYALTFNDDAMMCYAASNPKVFKDHLMNDNGLWHHSYWIDKAIAYPQNLFWGRGNGWVAFSYPVIGQNCNIVAELKADYKKTIDAMIKCQGKDGSFKTLLNRRESFKETSAATLFAAGIYRAIAIGMIDKSYLTAADKAFNYTMKKLVITRKKTLLKGISKPTIPRDHRPYIWYMKMTNKPNFSYGVAAFVFACMFKDDLNKTSK